MMIQGYQLHKNNKAFTLIELLVSMAVFGIIVGLVVNQYTSQQDSQLTQNQVVEMQQNIRNALIIMTRDIQMAGFDPEISKTLGIVNAGDGSNGNPLTFTYSVADDGLDNDGDGTIDESDEFQTIQYSLFDSLADGDMDIGRAVGAGGNQAIAENIQILQFTYLDGSGNPTATLSDIRAVRVAITATTDLGELRRAADNRTVTAVIKFRNIF
ncbi:MAG: prepilin-type N-terminal cleavage/methylation domain-containing protein [Desulfobacula sp.]|nr:prepilin-type N-terminal cleavage/methylation domain-containing protein [Desulfobacula sp.]